MFSASISAIDFWLQETPAEESESLRRPLETHTEQNSDQLTRAVRKAWLSYVWAELDAQGRLTDREAYELIREKGILNDQGERGELNEYRLPPFDTWTRQLRTARKTLGESKYTRRHGRSRGRSIVRSEEIEHQAADDNRIESEF